MVKFLFREQVGGGEARLGGGVQLRVGGKERKAS